MDELYEVCLRCGRKLKNEESKKLGYGKVCFQKQKAHLIVQALFDVPREGDEKDASKQC